MAGDSHDHGRRAGGTHDHGPGSSGADGHSHRMGATALGDLRGRQRRVLWWVLWLNGAVLVAEAAGGLAFDSLALLADAAHLLSDVAGLAVALGAHWLMTRPASVKHSYGLQRADVVGAQGNGVLLLAAAIWIFVEAGRRLDQPAEVQGGGLVAVAMVGLVVNVASAVALARARGRSLNMQGAYVHMVADAAGSVAAVVAGLAVLWAGADWVDPAVSVLIGVLVVGGAWQLLRDATHVLLEGTPAAVDPSEVAQALAAAPGIAGVHHVHVWSLASDTPALSAHVVVDGDPLLHDAQVKGDELRDLLAERFGIVHATLELECHQCEEPGSVSVPAVTRPPDHHHPRD